MRNACLLAVLWLATTYTKVNVGRAVAVQFDQQQQLPSPRYGDDYNNYYYHDGGPAAPLAELAIEPQESPRTHHGKHKLKKLKNKKRLLLQCLLGHGRHRRDSSAASGRFLLPVVLQSTNVNVGGSGGGGYGGLQQQQQSHHSGCMQMFGDDSHGPLQGASLPSLGSLGSLGSTLGSLSPFGPQVTEEPAEDEGGNRNGLSSYYAAADWNRYARQFRRNFVRPLYRLF